MRNRSIAGLAACLSVAACHGQAPPSIVQLGAGWNCLSYPTAFRPAGSVYQVANATGAQTTFRDFGAVVAGRVPEQPFVDLSATRNNKVNAGVVASLIGLPLKASANVA